jgi:alpha-N-arabinofuranosidase
MKQRIVLLVTILFFTDISAQQKAVLDIDAGKPGVKVASSLHGIFFEEISHGGEGGLYGELIQNRGFEESRLPPGTHLENGFLVPTRTPHFSIQPRVSDWRMRWPVTSPWPYWSLQSSGKADISLDISKENPLHNATPQSLQVTINTHDAEGKNNLVNEGFWGIKVVKGDKYRLSFYARTDERYKWPLTVSVQDTLGNKLASYTFKSVSGKEWKKYTATLQSKETYGKARLVISFGGAGTLWLDHVSLFPEKTFKNRPNGMRADLAQFLADLKPSFLRWPGGCFVEGITIESAPNWKNTLGPLIERPGTFSPWGYWSSDGFGYHEYLQFCEDIGADALYVFNAGVSCDYRSGTFIPDDQLAPLIADVLDAIEYAIGPATSKWGKVRAANGHPKPFPLKYVEVGNEQHGPVYARRYNWFHKAIKEKYPHIKVIASMGIGDINRRTLDSIQHTDIADEHAYKAAYWAFNNYDHFDRYRRGNYEVYVGEYATNSGVGRGNMLAALNDAVYILGMERNGDLVTMSSYAPLFENVNTRHWPVNLINFDAAASFGRISYYTIKMMNDHRADQNLASELKLVPPANPKAKFSGGIGLATWDTQTEYRDIQVYNKEGKLVYISDFINRPEDWQAVRGRWAVQDSALAQTAQGAQRLNLLKDLRFDEYTLKLKARKTGGTNAFIIAFAVQNAAKHLRAHIGSYVNVNSVFEMVSDSFSVADLMAQKRLPAKIETGRWYDIRLEVGLDKVDCYLDGKLLMSYTETPKLVSIAGRDEETGDIIIKMVNAQSEAYTTSININGIQETAATAELITLSAESPEAENSLKEPTKYVPRRSTIQGVKKSFEVIFPAYSVSVVRVKGK